MAERLAASDVDHRHVVREAGPKIVVAVDVNLLQLDVQAIERLRGTNRRLRLVAKHAIGAGVERDFDRFAHRVDSTAEWNRRRLSISTARSSSSPEHRAASAPKR